MSHSFEGVEPMGESVMKMSQQSCAWLRTYMRVFYSGFCHSLGEEISKAMRQKPEQKACFQSYSCPAVYIPMFFARGHRQLDIRPIQKLVAMKMSGWSCNLSRVNRLPRRYKQLAYLIQDICSTCVGSKVTHKHNPDSGKRMFVREPDTGE